MTMRFATVILVLASCALPCAIAQQAAPPAPSFAPANMTRAGVRGMAATCTACHGTNGNAAAQSAVPGLAGRSKDEIAQAMAQFKGGQRPATVMHQIAKGFSDAEVAAIADYFSTQAR
ncbi:MAG TPA: c-type cytochrome [Usitatibacter sp.]|nr:c-type cytochrome [Usitatibacter sp.]